MSLDEEDDIVKKNKVSRRNFLKGAAAGGAVAAVAVAGVAEMTILSNQTNNSSTTTSTSNSSSNSGSTTSTQQAQLTTSSFVTLNVNGVNHGLTIDNRWSLADALRYKLSLIGTKQGCERGECGACAVLVDGTSMLSCMLLAVEAGGHKIVTIEGLGGPTTLSKLQGALLDADGVQCGVCMPGIVVTTTELLTKNPKPTLDQIKQALSGNICRCQNWPHIFAGIQAATS
jgi:carbon-monoxide dehydrogenase small subunit